MAAAAKEKDHKEIGPLGAETVDVKSLRPFKIETLVDNSITDFDMYVKVEEHIVLYSGVGYKWNRDELQGLIKGGRTELLVRPADDAKAKTYLQLIQLPQLEKELAPKERIESIEQIAANFVKCLYEGEISQACVEKARGYADAIVDCIKEDKTCIKFLGALASHDYYTYFHSVRVATYATAIAMEMGASDDLIRTIALGGIFHDIGKRDVPLTVINKAGPLTDPEWKLMRAHPETGHKAVSDTNLVHVCKEIIRHHHERLDGSGYPDGLAKADLITEVQIATLADIFDALTSSRTYQNKRTRFEALDFIKHKMLSVHVWPEAFRALVSCLK